jgi:hypothetical protein
MDIQKTPKNPKLYICEDCNLSTSNKKDYSKHLLTAKHLKVTERYRKIQKNQENQECECGKTYKHYSGLWRHKKTCKKEGANMKETENEIVSIGDEEEKMQPDIAFFTNLVMEVVKNNSELQKQNQDFQKQMLELYKSNNTSVSNSHNNNSYNKTFNMQFFLNEQCKDAMNIMDFVDSMTLDFADLEDVGKLGYVEGMSGIIIRKLNELDIYKRPIHCSDGKREIMFVKDDNVWEKENGNYDRLRKAIKHITKKNGDLMIPWSKEHPNCMDIQHKMNDVYLQIMSQSMGGKESFVESENKIMKKIAKAVLIDK